MADPERYRQQLDKQADRQQSLQQLSLYTLRRRGRWGEREAELLKRMYSNAARGGDWEWLFEVLERTYVSIRRKACALKCSTRRRVS